MINNCDYMIIGIDLQAVLALQYVIIRYRLKNNLLR